MRIRPLLVLCPALLLVVAAPPSQALAATSTFYVGNGPTVSDSNACTAPTAPCQTIYAAMEKAREYATISIAAGSYPTGFEVSSDINFVGAGAGVTFIVP